MAWTPSFDDEVSSPPGNARPVSRICAHAVLIVPQIRSVAPGNLFRILGTGTADPLTQDFLLKKSPGTAKATWLSARTPSRRHSKESPMGRPLTVLAVNCRCLIVSPLAWRVRVRTSSRPPAARPGANMPSKAMARLSTGGRETVRRLHGRHADGSQSAIGLFHVVFDLLTNRQVEEHDRPLYARGVKENVRAPIVGPDEAEPLVRLHRLDLAAHRKRELLNTLILSRFYRLVVGGDGGVAVVF